MAVTILPAKEQGSTVEYVFAEVPGLGIAPGALYSESDYVDSSIFTDTFEIRAIVFEDGSSEGDPAQVREIEEERLGVQVQMWRTVKVLERFLAAGSSDWLEFKRNLELAVNSSDDDTVNILKQLKPSRGFTKQSLSRNLRSGLNNGRKRAISRAAEVEAMGSLDGFQYLKETYEKVLRQFPK